MTREFDQDQTIDGRTTRTIAKNAMFNFIATTSDVAINIVVGILLARGLGSTGYGVYSLIIWFLGLAVVLANLGLGDMTKRFVAEATGKNNTGTIKGIVRLALLLRGSAGLLISLAIILTSSFWAKLYLNPGDNIYFVLVALMLIPNVLINLFISIYAGFQKYEYATYLYASMNPLRAVLIIIVLALGLGVQQVLTVTIAAWVWGIIVAVFLLSRLIPIKNLFTRDLLKSADRKRALKYSILMAGTFLVSYVITNQAEIIFLGIYRPVEEVGYYTIAGKFPAMAMMLIPTVFTAVLLPTISEQFGRNDLHMVRRIYLTASRYVMMLAFFPAAIGVGLANPIITLLYGNEYASAIVIMQILFLPLTIWAISQCTTSVIWGINLPSLTLKVGLILACMNIGLSFLLIPKLGIIGAAIGSSIPRLISLPVYSSFLARRIGVKWPLSDTIKIVLASSIVGLALFTLQHFLSALLSIIIAVPVILVLFPIAIWVLRIVRSQDIEIMSKIQRSIPPALQKPYATLLRHVKRLAR